jgi:hypothetical protein
LEVRLMVSLSFCSMSTKFYEISLAGETALHFGHYYTPNILS